MNILFVCKHNRFRSKVAEAFLKKYDRKIKARSRATNPDYIPVAENVKKILGEFGIKEIDRSPRKLKNKDIKWADLIVIVADNVKLKVKKKKILVWEISDVSQSDIKGIKNRVGIIEKRVLNLICKLK